MSVAFRRDSDEEHLEPKFARPIPPGPNLVTAQGKAQIDAQVISCTALLADALDETAIAAAKRELGYWQTRQITAQIQPVPSGTQVEFGATVHFMLNGREQRLCIVGLDEADTATNLIGFTAPLARALMGADIGEVVPFGGKEDAIEILAIHVDAQRSEMRSQ